MKEYFDCFPFVVMDEIRMGNTVYVLNKKDRSVDCMNEMTVNDAFAIVKDAEKHKGQYCFWTEEEVNEEAEENGEL